MRDKASMIHALRQHFVRQGPAPTLIETHISWVLLVGDRAYKLKKPVDLGFLDFHTLERRLHFCREELRLNRRLAPGLYRSVHAVRLGPQGPTVDEAPWPDEGDAPPGDPVIDVALRMTHLPPHATGREQLARGTLTREHLQSLARTLAAFQHKAPVAPPESPFGRPEGLRDQMLRAAEALGERLLAWLARECDTLMPLWAARRAAGRVREGHGDLHLDNIVVLDDGTVTAFDCLEFDPALRWIDVAADIGFLAMDVQAHGRPDLAFAFLDAWLEASGDFDALPMLRAVGVYRAGVRALVSALRERTGVHAAGLDAAAYRACAQALIAPREVTLVITHGLPGSGKTHQSQRWLEAEGAVRLRSDVERKRLAGLGPLDDSRAQAGLDLYTPAHTEATFARLEALADAALQAGYPVVVDAAFLKRAQRDRFRALAARRGVRLAILDCTAPMDALRERVSQRQARGGDASEADVAVLERLAAAVEPLGDDERVLALPVRTGSP